MPSRAPSNPKATPGTSTQSISCGGTIIFLDGMKKLKLMFDYMDKNGVDKSRLEAIGMGEADPIADNSTAEGRELNRRIMMKRIQ